MSECTDLFTRFMVAVAGGATGGMIFTLGMIGWTIWKERSP